MHEQPIRTEGEDLREEIDRTRADVSETVDEIARRIKAPAGPIIALVAVTVTAAAAYAVFKFGRPWRRRR